MAYTFKKGILPTEEIGYFEEMNPGWKCTGETLEEEFTDSRGFVHGCTYAVMTGKWTPYGMCRDCGSHYIIARWSRYDSIDKETLETTYDVEDR